jgi:hypothetical protein
MHALANVATHQICGQHDCASVSLISRPGAIRKLISITQAATNLCEYIEAVLSHQQKSYLSYSKTLRSLEEATSSADDSFMHFVRIRAAYDLEVGVSARCEETL